jgi:isopentenyldiphosphate isomerase
MNEKLVDRAEQKMQVAEKNGNLTGEIVRRADAHSSPGIKHLAFLVFVVNDKKEFVLHKRIGKKIGGDTIDSPVSHVLEGETVEQAVHRALKHEYGIEETLPVTNMGGFSYEQDYGDGTCENEYCLSLLVEYSGPITPNPEEIEGEVILIPIKEAIADSKANVDKYAVWFLPAVELFEKSEAAKQFI